MKFFLGETEGATGKKNRQVKTTESSRMCNVNQLFIAVNDF